MLSLGRLYPESTKSMSAKPMKQNGRLFTVEEIAYAEQFVRRFSNLTRSELIDTLCEHWNWFTASGSCKSQSCLALLKRLENKKRITLPASKFPAPRKMRAPTLTTRTEPQAKLNCTLKELGNIELVPAQDKAQRALLNEYIERYHYLGYKKPAGNIFRYFIMAGGSILGCLIIAGAAKRITVRDAWIGWSDDRRLSNLPWVINNTRFLIFPWVDVPHLASHVLGKLARQIRNDYLNYWRYGPLLLETFVNPEHYQGTCYKAANWIYLGETSGRERLRLGAMPAKTPKMIFVYSLAPDAREQLSTINLLAKQGETHEIDD
jgi:hypothetical protein